MLNCYLYFSLVAVRVQSDYALLLITNVCTLTRQVDSVETCIKASPCAIQSITHVPSHQTACYIERHNGGHAATISSAHNPFKAPYIYNIPPPAAVVEAAEAAHASLRRGLYIYGTH